MWWGQRRYVIQWARRREDRRVLHVGLRALYEYVCLPDGDVVVQIHEIIIQNNNDTE